MKKVMLTTVLCFCFLSADAETNPMLGKWTQGSDKAYCKTDSITFDAHQARHVTDADGSSVEFLFKNVSFDIKPSQVTVDFHEPHGFGAALSATKIDFKILDASHIRMMSRKKRPQDFVRCP